MADMQMAAQTAGGCSDAQGTLPACAPLANPYVPFQNDNPERYAAGRALMKGTLFPGLDLPYRGAQSVEPRSEEEMQRLQELQAANFAITELGLYLDTHADDAEAVQLFTNTSSNTSCCASRWRTAALPSRRRRPPCAAGTPGWMTPGPGTQKRRLERCLSMKRSCSTLCASQTRTRSSQLS